MEDKDRYPTPKGTDMTEIITVNASEFGVDKNKAAEIKKAFVVMLDKMEELEVEAKQVFVMDVSETSCKLAKAVRLKYVKVRTATAAIHKKLKADAIAYGRCIDAWKNTQLEASRGIEERLGGIENHYENAEKERVEKLQEARASELLAYGVNVDDPEQGQFPALGTMIDDVWSAYLEATKKRVAEEKEALRVAEEQRLAELAAKEAEDKRIREENAALQAELDTKKAEEEARQKEEARIEAERAAKEREVTLAHEAEVAAEKARADKLEAEAAAVTKAEQDRVAAEEEAVRLEEAAKAEEAQKLAAAPDKEKLDLFVKEHLAIRLPSVETEGAMAVTTRLFNKLEEFYALASKEIASL